MSGHSGREVGALPEPQVTSMEGNDSPVSSFLSVQPGPRSSTTSIGGAVAVMAAPESSATLMMVRPEGPHAEGPSTVDQHDGQMITDDRFQAGMKVFREISADADSLVGSLADISPELAQLAVRTFAEIYARPGLSPRDRELMTLGMLTALGGCESQLEVHIKAALNVGLTHHEITEALLHSAGYCGIPKALNATFVARKVFAERGLLLKPAD